MDLGKFEKKEYFVNRELSWLKFDERVLSEARDKNLPLFDRLKFLSITASNLDEFFMVRVASLKDQVHAGYHKTDIAGMTAKEQLKEISARTHELVHLQYNTLNRSLLPALEKSGMHLVAAHEDLTEEQKVSVMAAVYDSNGKLIGIKPKEISLKPGNENQVEFKEISADSADEYTIKILTWNGNISSLAPISNTLDLSIK